MKKQRFCKSTVSLLLVFMMLISMVSVGIVNAGAAEADVAETGSVTYYFGFTSWSTFHKVNMQATGKSDDYTSLVNCNTTVSHDIGNNVGTKTYNVYSLTVDSSYTTAYVTITNNNQSYETAAITLDSSKITLISEYGGVARFGQTAYGSSGDTTTEEFPIDFIEGERVVYVVDQAGWGSVKCYAWTKDTTTANATFPGVAMTDTGEKMNGYKIYKYTVDSAYNMVIFSGGNTQTADLTFKQYNYYNNSTGTWTYKAPVSGGSTTDPTEPDDSDTVRIYVRDNCTSWDIESDDANFYAKGDDGVIVKMTETIDTISGKILWYADVASTNTSFTVYRASYFCDESNVASKAWNSWSAGTRSSNVCYNITGTSGSWVNSTVKAADINDITNFWYGVWVDTCNNQDTKTVVRSELSGNTLSLYLPSYVDLGNIKLYSSFKSATLKGGAYTSGKALAQGSPTTVTLATGTTYSLSTTNDNSSAVNYTLKVYTTSDTASMLMTTEEELFTGTTSGLSSSTAWPSGMGITADNFSNFYKDAIETKGSIYVFSENGKLVNDGDGETKLKKIKGRGNSTFKASMQLYGKYAYNFNLDKKVDLTVLDDGVTNASTESKKWCLLANNPDITMMRNTFVYSLADDIGLKYGPETRLVDVYDNGKYLGAYIITEKVEYGKNTLMNDMKNLDDGNTDANSVPHPTDEEADPLYEFDTDDLNAGTVTTYTTNNKKYDCKYYTTYDRPAYEDENGNTVAAASNLEYQSPSNYNTKYNYLLEFELYDRYQNEASWFKSPRTGQAVVVKYPEFATREEMEWIISEYEKAESAIYSDDTDAIKATVDVDSFARMYLIQELGINLDSCATSYYIHNEFQEDGSSKLVASPVWDYDWSFGAYMNTTNSGKKYVYNGSSVSVNSTTLDNPKQMFVKNKALKTDEGDSTKTSNYNFQAKLVHNDYVWGRCQYYWTNLFVPNLARYVDNDYIDSTSQKTDGVDEGRMLTEWLPRFRSSMAMNDARWGSITYTGDDWGTKITTNYDPHTFDFKVGQSIAGSKTKSYDNSVYYLNDWIVTRWNYMSDDGGLYDETLKETITAENAAFTATQDGDQLTITASVELTYNGDRVDGTYPESITYDIYVNGTKKASNTLDKSTTITLASGVESNIYIKAYLTNAPNTYATSETQTFSYGVDYKVENVSFTAEQNDAAVTISPSATVTYQGNSVTPDKVEYTVYVNGTAVSTKTFGEGSTTVVIESGKTSDIYIKVNPVNVAGVSGTSMTQQFTYGVEVEMVTVTLHFKSSSSYRYTPKVKVNGNDEVAMNKYGNAIGKNASQTQSYYWFEVVTEVEKDVATSIVFRNAYSMNGATTIKPSENTEYYLAVDNINDGATVVDLSQYNTSEFEYILNFCQSASHMVYSSTDDTETAQTSINGTRYKLGDATNDGSTNIMDATAIQLALAEKSELSDVGSDLADFNLDTQTSIMDVTQIQIYIAQ